MKTLSCGILFGMSIMLAGAPAVPENATVILDAFAADRAVEMARIATPKMAAALGGEKLVLLRKKTTDRFGAFIRWEGGPTVRRIDVGKVAYWQVFRTADLAWSRLEVLCTVEVESGKVAGFFIQPLPNKPRTNEVYREEELTFGTIWKLSGTLTCPSKATGFPIVVLVHGSGLHDRDETIGPNKPFAELAYGLSQRGIAVFRYDKRTLIYGKKMAGREFSLADEVTDDAILAVAMLRKKFPRAPIFVLGHSLGGMLLPRIAAGTAIPSGYIFMAAAARRFEVGLDAQLEYLIGLQPGSREDKQKLLEAQRREIINSVSPAYYHDLSTYDPVAAARKMTGPMLFLQGGRDDNVRKIAHN
ncbi:MAG: alpha/beta fold hydrolase [Victivallales bacterium]|nr:alpha/beta fold hydrolase [Victivallales bacterium]